MKKGVLQSITTYDILKDEPRKIMLGVCLPLVFASILSWLTSSLTNALYARFGGAYFAASGMIGIVVTSLNQIVSCIVGAAWILTASDFKSATPANEKPYFANAVYAIFTVESLLVLACLVAKTPIFRAFNIPAELYRQTNVYYIVSIASFYLTSVGIFGVTLVNGVGDSRKLLIANLRV